MAKNEEIPPHRPPAAIHPVFVFPTPDKRDLLFYVEVDARIPRDAPTTWTYGDAFTGPPSGYQDYKLVHVSEQTTENWERRWYAKDWEDQDAHNWTFTDGDQLIRTYLVRRTDYRQRKVGVTPSPASEFLYPAGATADTVFTDYGFVNDTVSEAPDPLKGLYVVVQRRYAIPVQTNVIFDDTIDQNVTVTREIIDKMVKATATLTSTGVAPANGATVTAGGKTYTFQTVLTNVDGNVLIGGSAAAALDNFKSAVNLSSGAGTTYAAATTVNTQVSATTNTATTQKVQALDEGSAGNSIAVSETSTVLTWGASTLSGGSGDEIGESVPGTNIEREYGDKFHDVLVTSSVNLTDLSGDPTSYPVQMTSFLTDIPYKFPQLLRGARIVAAWAIADSDNAARSYDESWYIKWDLVDPMIGPYEARVLRYLTNDPNDLRSDFPIQKIVTVRELIGITRAWAHASSKGNSTYAEARQIEVPPAIHGDITIENGETLSVGQSTNFLPATPQFGTVVGQASMIVAYETKQTRFGLYIVEITEVNCTGVYNGIVVPFGTTFDPGVLLPDMGAGLPPVDDTDLDQPSATISTDNTTVSGVTSPGASVKVFNGVTEVGRATATTGAGTYSLLLDTVYTNPVTLTVRSYLNGTTSPATTLVTYNLRPDRPSGYLAADGTTVQGTTEASITVNILVNASAQVETATLPAFYPQVETLTFAGAITVDGDIPVAFVSAIASDSVDVPALIGETPAQLAEKARILFQSSGIANDWDVTRSGDDLIFTAIVPAADDATAEGSITDPNGTGVTPATSADTTPGGTTPVAITTAGTIIATVVSGIASWGTLNVPFTVAVTDDPTDIATKAAAALAASPVADYYTPSSSTNNVILTALTAAEDDPVLNIALTEGTCDGFANSPAISTNTTAGGTGVSILSNASGAYTYAFATALTPGDLVQVTATDAGGTSQPLLLEASASPPTLSTAVLSAAPNSNIVTGTGTVAAKIIAYVGDTDVGDAIVNGGGTYSLTMDYKMVRGERIQAVAVIAGNEDVRSAPIFLTATDLNLEVPVFELTDAGYVGVAPAGATEIRIRKVSDLSETLATIHANRNFVFTLTGDAGAAFDVYARYANGDSDVVRVFIPTVPKAAPLIRLSLGVAPDSLGPSGTISGYTRAGEYLYQMSVSFQTWVDGMDITISFPGTALVDIVFTNFVSERAYYSLSPLEYAVIQWPFGQIPPNAIRGSTIIPLDVTNPAAPVPYDTVKVTLNYPDGDEVSSVFNASTWNDPFGKYANGAWNFGFFLTPYEKRKSQDFYDV